MIVLTDRLTEHFKLSEFAHHENGDLQIWIDEAFIPFVSALEEFRVWYHRPININSGFRPAAYNRAVGGSSNSSHLRTCAVDFNLPLEYKSFTPARREQFLRDIRAKWICLCNIYGYKAQCNWYDSYIHLGFSFGTKSSFLDKRTVK